MTDFATSIEIDADPAVVFDYLVTEAGMTAWMGQHAALDARPGGELALDIAGAVIRGEYLVVDRPHRVVFTWGMAGSTELPPGASTVEFTLTPTHRGTRVALLHAGLPEPQLKGHAAGWAHFLPRLTCVGGGGDPGLDDWAPVPDDTEADRLSRRSRP